MWDVFFLGTARSIPSQISVIMPGMVIEIAGSAIDDEIALARPGTGARVANNAIAGRRLLRDSIFDSVAMAEMLAIAMAVQAPGEAIKVS